MARPRGGDSATRRKQGAKGRAHRARQVYIFTEGEVTEPEYIDLVAKNLRRSKMVLSETCSAGWRGREPRRSCFWP